MQPSTKLDPSKIDQAAQYLVAARRAQRAGDRIPESCRPADVEAALAIQQRVTELMNETAGGWKCAVPSAQVSVMLAPVLQSSLYRVSPVEVWGDKGRIEPEIAFVLNR